MLVLGRRKNDTIRIGQDVVLRVLSIDGNRVSLGIDAPRDVVILRGELEERDVERHSATDTGGNFPLPPASVFVARD